MKSRELDNVDQFVSPESWTGGHYELVIYLGERSDTRAETALHQLWSHPSLYGCFLSRFTRIPEQTPVRPQDHLGEQLYGIAILPNGSKIPCGSVLYRLESGTDWLGLFLPLGSVAISYPVGPYPFTEQHKYFEWQQDIDRWLSSVGHHVFKGFPFEFAIIGFEAEFSAKLIESARKNGVPDDRDEGWLWRERDGLHWYPPTFSIV